MLQILETVEDDCPKLKIKALGLLRNILCDPDEVDRLAEISPGLHSTPRARLIGGQWPCDYTI